jgi:hypothetical protein
LPANGHPFQTFRQEIGTQPGFVNGQATPLVCPFPEMVNGGLVCRMKTQDLINAPAIRLALTRKQTAAALGISPITVDRLTKRKLLRPSRATRRPLYSVKELERFLRETTAEIPATQFEEIGIGAGEGGANES